MKFSVQSKTLSTAVSAVSKVINSKNAMAVLNNFLFELNEGVLTVIGSDLENTLKIKLNVANSDSNMRFCVDARRMVDLMKELPDVGVNFEINPETYEIKITYTGGNYEFMGIRGEEYPETISSEENEQNLHLECAGSIVLSGIDNTIFAVGTEAVRPQMMGILWDIHYSDITFVASDTHKLVRFINTNFEPGIEGSFILPVKPANILKSILGKDDNLKITLTHQNVTFSNGEFELCSSFIKGEFPAYNKVIPVSNPYTLTIDRQQLLNSVRRMSIFGDQSHKLMKFRITPEQIVIKTQDKGFCTLGEETLRCDFTGTEMVIGFSAQFLIEIFSTLTTENVVIQLADPSRPGVFTPSENQEKCDLVILLMPMSVTEF